MRGRDRPGSAGGRGAGHARRYGNRGDAVRDHAVRGPHRRPAGVAARRRGNREGDRGPAGRVTGGRELPRRDVGARRRDALRVLLRLRGRDDLGRDGPDPEALSGAGDRGPVSDETLLTNLTDGVARITLNRPEVRNALSRTMVAELEAALASFEADPAARVIVLAGAGDRAFCAGADLKGAGDRGTTLQARESFGGLARILEAMARMRTPVIAQVHGVALAGGCGLAVGCDIVVAADDAVFGLPEIKIGLLPFIVMAPILRSVGRKRTMLMILSGFFFKQKTAYEMGL